MSSPLRTAVIDALAVADDGLLVRDVVAAVRRSAPRMSRAAVERLLADDDLFVDDGGGLRARWTLASGAGDAVEVGPRSVRDGSGRMATPVDATKPLDDLPLRDWQVAAFAAWATNDCRGVVEAVTGAGKTRLAVAAVRAALARDGRALVLAPTLDLVGQWRRELRRHVPHARIGVLGAGHHDDLHDHHVVVATPHTAATVPITPPDGVVGLLVADEAHRYGAPTWATALRPQYRMRLALTATYERNDDGIADVLGPYFGGVVHAYGFAEAAADGVIAPMRVVLAGTGLDASERERYDLCDRRARDLLRTLQSVHGLSRDPRRAIQEAAQLVAQASGEADVAARTASAWLSAVRSRRDAAAQCAGKLDVVRQAAPALHGRRTLVFTDTVEQAEQAARLLRRGGLRAEEIHGDLPGDRRRIRLAQFARGSLDAVTAPRVLDEGVDVPDADVAIVLAAFRTRRQMIQRLGRVLRVKDDGREARLVIAYAIDTREDPDQGGHRDFLDEVGPVARSVERLNTDEAPSGLFGFLTRSGGTAAGGGRWEQSGVVAHGAAHGPTTD